MTENMTPNEYLDFIIQVYFKQYHNSDIFISVWDTDKRYKYSTLIHQQTFNYKVEDVYLVKYQNNPFYTGYENLMKFNLAQYDTVIQNGCIVSTIIFDKYKNRIGAILTRYVPILFNNKVCGVATYIQDVTHSFFSLRVGYSMSHAIYSQPELRNKIKQLTIRQKQVLFLLILGFTQEGISEVLITHRGTISRTIRNICEKFSLTLMSAANLIASIDKAQFFEEMNNIEVIFNPIYIKL